MSTFFTMPEPLDGLIAAGRSAQPHHNSENKADHKNDDANRQADVRAGIGRLGRLLRTGQIAGGQLGVDLRGKDDCDDTENRTEEDADDRLDQMIGNSAGRIVIGLLPPAGNRSDSFRRAEAWFRTEEASVRRRAACSALLRREEASSPAALLQEVSALWEASAPQPVPPWASDFPQWRTRFPTGSRRSFGTTLRFPRSQRRIACNSS